MLGLVSFQFQEVVDSVLSVAVQYRFKSQFCGQCPLSGPKEIAVGHAENPDSLVLLADYFYFGYKPVKPMYYFRTPSKYKSMHHHRFNEFSIVNNTRYVNIFSSFNMSVILIF